MMCRPQDWFSGSWFVIGQKLDATKVADPFALVGWASKHPRVESTIVLSFNEAWSKSTL